MSLRTRAKYYVIYNVMIVHLYTDLSTNNDKGMGIYKSFYIGNYCW